MEELKEAFKEEQGPDSSFVSLDYIENLMVKKLMDVSFFEKNIKENLLILDDFLNKHGLDCYDSVSSRDGYVCKVFGYSCKECPFKFNSIKDLFKGTLLFQNYNDNGKTRISFTINGYLNKSIVEITNELLFELRKITDADFLHERALIEKTQSNPLVALNPYDLSKLTIDDSRLYAVLYVLNKRAKRGIGYFSYFGTCEYKERLIEICNLLFKSV